MSSRKRSFKKKSVLPRSDLPSVLTLFDESAPQSAGDAIAGVPLDEKPLAYPELQVIEDILAMRKGSGGKKEYLCRWFGLPAKFDSWEPPEHIFCKAILDDFNKSWTEADELAGISELCSDGAAHDLTALSRRRAKTPQRFNAGSATDENKRLKAEKFSIRCTRFGVNLGFLYSSSDWFQPPQHVDPKKYVDESSFDKDGVDDDFDDGHRASGKIANRAKPQKASSRATLEKASSSATPRKSSTSTTHEQTKSSATLKMSRQSSNEKSKKKVSAQKRKTPASRKSVRLSPKQMGSLPSTSSNRREEIIHEEVNIAPLEPLQQKPSRGSAKKTAVSTSRKRPVDEDAVNVREESANTSSTSSKRARVSSFVKSSKRPEPRIVSSKQNPPIEKAGRSKPSKPARKQIESTKERIKKAAAKEKTSTVSSAKISQSPQSNKFNIDQHNIIGMRHTMKNNKPARMYLVAENGKAIGWWEESDVSQRARDSYLKAKTKRVFDRSRDGTAYSVDFIIDGPRAGPHGAEYKVKWAGYSGDVALAWVAVDAISSDLIQAFKRKAR